jgi:hypothetical protein
MHMQNIFSRKTKDISFGLGSGICHIQMNFTVCLNVSLKNPILTFFHVQSSNNSITGSELGTTALTNHSNMTYFGTLHWFCPKNNQQEIIYFCHRWLLGSDACCSFIILGESVFPHRKHRHVDISCPLYFGKCLFCVHKCRCLLNCVSDTEQSMFFNTALIGSSV